MSDLLKVKVGGSSYLCKWEEPVIYKTNFTNFDVNTLTDIPIKGETVTYTKGQGGFTIQSSSNGLLLNGGYSYDNSLYAVLSTDFSTAKEVAKTSKMILNRMPPYAASWCWLNKNAANAWTNRGQGLFMFSNNLTTDYSKMFSEYHGSIYFTFCVPSPGQYYIDQEIDVTEVWSNDGIMKWYFNNNLAGINTNVNMSSDLNNHFKELSIGVSDSEIICKEISISAKF